MHCSRGVRLAVATAVLAIAVACASYEGARLYVSGTEALDRGETAVAIAQLERAAQLVPDASEIENHLGLAYVRAGRPNDARAAFRRALALDCDNTAARANLAMAERTQEDRRIPEEPRTPNDRR